MTRLPCPRRTSVSQREQREQEESTAIAANRSEWGPQMGSLDGIGGPRTRRSDRDQLAFARLRRGRQERLSKTARRTRSKGKTTIARPKPKQPTAATILLFLSIQVGT